MFDFDAIPDRSGTASLKWEKFAPNVLPMWVADMDFPSPPAVIEALHSRTDHGIYGYTTPPTSLVEAIIDRADRKYQWQIEPDWLVFLPGLMPALNLVCRAFAKEREEIISPTPIYPPFLSAPRYQRRKRVTVATDLVGGRWQLQPQAIRDAITPDSRVFLFCNPHNPVGRAYGRKEAEEIATVCLEQDLVICSDEIHCDLLLDDLGHTPTASISPEIAARTITLMAPSKTYNLPGLACAYAIIPNETLRRRFKRAMRGLFDGANCLGYAACEAAYRHGADWEAELLHYLRGSRDVVESFVEEELPGLSMTHVEATYLAWIDARELGLDDPAAFFVDAGIGLMDGKYFGGDGFVRLNFACPRATLLDGLNRMKTALESR